VICFKVVAAFTRFRSKVQNHLMKSVLYAMAASRKAVETRVGKLMTSVFGINIGSWSN
jgi:hypothetical protein